ncbi:CotH kinase family protein, partial [Bacillus vallismortis]|nr:CotH kinase family protein [Bacillus vallismortis]
YKQLLEKTLQSLFTIEYMKPKIMAIYEQIRPFVLMDPYKKNDIERFDREPDVICEYIIKRSDYLKSELDLLY